MYKPVQEVLFSLGLRIGWHLPLSDMLLGRTMVFWYHILHEVNFHDIRMLVVKIWSDYIFLDYYASLSLVRSKRRLLTQHCAADDFPFLRLT